MPTSHFKGSMPYQDNQYESIFAKRKEKEDRDKEEKQIKDRLGKQCKIIGGDRKGKKGKIIAIRQRPKLTKGFHTFYTVQTKDGDYKELIENLSITN